MVRLEAVVRSDSQIKRIVDRLKGGMPAAMQAVAQALHANAMDAFRSETSPYGEKWAPLKESTLMLRAKGFHLAGPRISKTKKKRTLRQVARIVNNAKTLVDKGTLRKTIVPQSTPHRATLTVGGPAAQYAHVHQLGNPDNRIPNRQGGNPAPIPARPYLPVRLVGGRIVVVLPAKLRDEVVGIIRTALLKGIR